MTADLRCPAGTFFQRSNIMVWNEREQMDSGLFLEGDARESDGCFLRCNLGYFPDHFSVRINYLCLMCYGLIIQEVGF